MASVVELAGLEEQAADVASLLRLIANEKRLLILCLLSTQREMTVTELAEAVGLSQSALSQHLGKMRADGLVTTRRQAQMLFYRIADDRVESLLGAMAEIFCPELGAAEKGRKL